MENKSRGKSKRPNDKKFNGRSQSRDRSQFKGTRECFYCGKKMAIEEEIVGIGIKTKLKVKMKRMIMRKLL